MSEQDAEYVEPEGGQDREGKVRPLHDKHPDDEQSDGGE